MNYILTCFGGLGAARKELIIADIQRIHGNGHSPSGWAMEADGGVSEGASPAVAVGAARGAEPACRSATGQGGTGEEECSRPSERTSYQQEPVQLQKVSVEVPETAAAVSRPPQEQQQQEQQQQEQQTDGEQQARAEAAAANNAQLREGMVLSGLASIVTAFSASGREVLYQNAQSVAYLGMRVMRPASCSTADTAAGASAGGAAAVGGASGSRSILEEIFSLEPAKLDRMLEEVRTAGNTWKGIVQVPLPLELRPAANATTDTAVASGVPPPVESHVLSSPVFAAALISRVSMGGNAAEAGAGLGDLKSDIFKTFDGALCGTPNRVDRQSSLMLETTEPLATSTWGLVLDLPPAKPRPPASSAPQRTGASQLPSGGRGLARAGAGMDGLSSILSFSQDADEAGAAATEAEAASSLLSAPPALRPVELLLAAPRVSSNASLQHGVMRRSATFHPSSDMQQWQQAYGGAHAAEMGPGSAHGSGGAAAAAATGGIPLRRCTSRADLSLRISPKAPVLRVVAFASSLKVAPPVRQPGLQGPVGSDASDVAASSVFSVDSDSRHRPMASVRPDLLAESGSASAAPAPPVCGVTSAGAGTDRQPAAHAAPADAAPLQPAARRAKSGLLASLAASAKSWTAGQPLARAVSRNKVHQPLLAAGVVEGASRGQHTQGAGAGGRMPTGVQAATAAASSTAVIAGGSSSTAVAGTEPAGPAADVPKAAAAAAGDVPAAGSAPGSSLLAPRQGSGGASRVSGQLPGYCWHEMYATRQVDPVTGQMAIVLAQTDVTAKVEAETHIALVTEVQHRLLEQIFPRHVLAYMTEEGGPWNVPSKATGRLTAAAGCQGPMDRDVNKLATAHEEVTLLFADIEGFTPMCGVLEPRVVMAFLNDLFTRFDKRLDEFGVYKVETIGDCYFVAGGLIQEDEEGTAMVRARKSHADPLHAEKVFMFAKAMLAAAAQVTLPTTGGPVRMRIGIHSGPVVSGVVGQRMPRFCLFGDTVNTTSRMESTGVPGCIHASAAAKALLRKEAWVPTGGIEVKGKGRMETYLWAPPGVRSQARIARHAVASTAVARKPTHGSVGSGAVAATTAATSGGSGGKSCASSTPPSSCVSQRTEAAAGSGGGGGGGGAGLEQTGAARQVEESGSGVPPLHSRGRHLLVLNAYQGRGGAPASPFSSSAALAVGPPNGASASSRQSSDMSGLTDSVAGLATYLLSKGDACTLSRA